MFPIAIGTNQLNYRTKLNNLIKNFLLFMNIFRHVPDSYRD